MLLLPLFEDMAAAEGCAARKKTQHKMQQFLIFNLM